MIKVNLLRNLKAPEGNSQMGERTITQTIQFKSSESVDPVTLIWKLVILFVPVTFLYLWSSSIVSNRTSQLTKERKQIETADGEILELKKQYKDLRGYKQESDNLNLLINAIATLSKKRLSTIRALDSMQTLTPPQVWYTDLKVGNDLIVIQGVATTADSFTDFIKQLTDSVFFSKVETVKVEEEKRKYGPVKKFEVNCHLEKI